MKFSSLLLSLLATAAQAQPTDSAPEVENQLPSARYTANGEKILPRLSELKAPGVQRVTKAYGSYMVSSSRMMTTFKLSQGPCGAGGCYVTAMEATIRYPNKKEANIDSGAWLHHIALFGTGAGGGSIWAAGNERPTLRLNMKEKYGIDFPGSFLMMIDLMTEEVAPKNLTLEISYDIVPKSNAEYGAVAMYWLTIGEPAAKQGVYKFNTIGLTSSGHDGSLLYSIGHMHDGGTDMRLFVNNKLVCKSIMHYNAREGYGGKANSGGSGGGSGGLAGLLGGGAPAAKSQGKDAKGKGAKDAKSAKGAAKSPFGGAGAAKGGAKDDMGDMAGMSHGHSGKKVKRQHAHAASGSVHISDPGACTDFGTVKKGEQLRAEAWYDATKFPLMEHNGKKEALMGNMRVYIGVPSSKGGKGLAGGGLIAGLGGGGKGKFGFK